MGELNLNFENELSKTACQSGPTPAGVPGHDVQFYRTEKYLTRAVVDFLAGGVRAGQPIIVIATREHRQSFEAGLRSAGLDPESVFSGRLAVWLDARETLDAFMDRGQPNRELFYATVGSVFQRILDKRSYLVVRTYGEMVDVLFRDGNPDGAIALEKLWNELGEKYKYSLLCGYSLDNFLHEKGVDAFRNVCGHHTNTLPLESLDQNVA